LTSEELAKVRECLDLLQHAQNIVNCAAQALCSVRGFANEWGKLVNAYDAIKAEWYMVNDRAAVIQHDPPTIDD
jgi:hypothetical protein